MFNSNASSADGGANYIEEVFSTWLYTGTGASQTITNGIDLSTKGGLTWIKGRSIAYSNVLFDTTRGAGKYLQSNSTGVEQNFSDSLSSFNANGFSLGSDSNGVVNTSVETYASWTFRKQPKFFDIVTYTGDGTSNRAIPHNLGSVPGCIIVKGISIGLGWPVYHRGMDVTNPEFYEMFLNTTAAKSGASNVWGGVPTSTNFYVNNPASVNQGGETYVAYIFAHNAGGFGLTGSDNVISCGNYVKGASADVVNLGYEPQWVLLKNASVVNGWQIADNMRGWFTGSDTNVLSPNTSAAETTTGAGLQINSNGFQQNDGSIGNTYIYVAIRRGPMKVPTLGTSVFGISARTGTGADATVTGSAGVSDAVLVKNRGSAVASLFSSRLTSTGYLVTSTTAAEVAAGATILQANPWDVMDGVKVGTTSTITNASANTFINYLFDRAPGYMDVVCYTGNGSTQTITHNLGVVPELIIGKCRTTAGLNWPVLFNFTPTTQDYAFLNLSSAGGIGVFYAGAGIFTAAPTSTSMFLDSSGSMNTNAAGQVAYLFATCAGVSKVGTYTGTGTTQTINCGFTAGSRFVTIKRVDSTGDWYVWDSARGIIAGNDPYLLLNSSAAEVTGTDYVDTAATGFELSSTAPAALNDNGGTYIFLAIA
jgi:hypothetical protein